MIVLYLSFLLVKTAFFAADTKGTLNTCVYEDKVAKGHNKLLNCYVTKVSL